MQQKNNETQEKYDYNFKLMSGGKDSMIIVWDLNNESNNLIFKGHESPISCICTL